MLKVIVISVSAVFLSGCASSIGAFFSRPVVQDQVGTIGTLAQSADRRTVLVVTSGTNSGRFCAEPPPDSAVGIKTDLQASFEASARKLGLGDKLETTVNVLADRTPALDMFRTGTYALCQYQLNGQLTAAQVETQFKNLIDAFVKVESLRVPIKTSTPTSAPASAPK